ncbi:MAG: serine hydrolase [Azospirillaceae bacterium]
MTLDSTRLADDVRTLLETYNVPGAAVGVARGGETVFRHLHGVMSVDDGRPVTERSLFDIGSISKTVNAAALALVIDRGEADWDDRAIDHLPDWRLSDASLTPMVRLRDLVGQRIGHGEDNITNYHSHFSRDQIIAQIADLPLRVGFRSECAYQSYGPISAGAVVERRSGRSWEDFVESEICKPLGLADTFASYFRLADTSIACDAHVTDADGISRVVPHRNFDNLAPAGSVVSSLRDMERWFSLFALGGTIDGTRLLKEETVREMLRPGVLVNPTGIHPQRWVSRYEAKLVGYGCGWYAHDFAGHRISEHTGALEGFFVLGCAVPEAGLAVVILTNQHKSDVVNPLRYLLLAEALGLPQRDWDARFRKVSEGAKRPLVMLDGEPYYWRPLMRHADWRPSFAAADYAGDYANPVYGTVPVRLDGEGLTIDIIGNPCVLEHWHGDLFRAVPRDAVIASYYPEIFVRFAREDHAPLLRLEIPTIGRFKQTGTS